MSISSVIKARQSTRAFLNKSVPKTDIETILDAARWAPSSTNTQPWQVAVLQGEQKQKLSDVLQACFDNKQAKHLDYAYSPKGELPEIYQKRRFTCGKALYKALNIQREDKEKRIAAWRKNYAAFDAPVMLLFFIEPNAGVGSYIDYGMFLQNIMLAASEFGLATCVQASLAEYPDIVREHLGEGYTNQLLVCGMSLGYPDESAAVNQYRTEREEVNGFAHWYE